MNSTDRRKAIHSATVLVGISVVVLPLGSSISRADNGQNVIAAGNATGTGATDSSGNGGYAVAYTDDAHPMAGAYGGGGLGSGGSGGWAEAIGYNAAAEGGGGGPGGNGYAESTDSDPDLAAPSSPNVSLTALGANGGISAASGAPAGDGGNATAIGTAIGTPTSNGANITVWLYSGTGGTGTDADGGYPGQIGIGTELVDGSPELISMQPSATATTNYSGAVSASLSAYGGGGGYTLSGGNPTPGESVTLTNTVAGYGGGSITLTQLAQGGSGASGLADASAGGNAVSDYTHTIQLNGGGQPTENESSLNVTTTANGGSATGGGSDQNGTLIYGYGGVGGNATADTELAAPSPCQTYLIANAKATGGNGGSGTEPLGVDGGGVGGTATATAKAITITAGQGDEAHATATGGYGGAGGGYSSAGAGGMGGDAIATATAATLGGLATATAKATGELGGSSDTAGGNGGNATATAIGNAAVSLIDDVTATAQGGQGGGSSAGGTTGGWGGSAEAVLEIAGIAKIEQISPGGAPQNNGGGGAGGYAYLSFDNDTLQLSPGGENVNNGPLAFTGTDTMTLNCVSGSGTIVVGTGTDSTTLLLTSTNSNYSTIGSFFVNAGSTLGIFTDSTSTTVVGSGNVNNGTLNVTGTGSTTIGSVSGTGSFNVGNGTNPTTLQLNTTGGSTTSQFSFTVNAGSTLNLFTDPTSTTSVETTVTNNGHLNVTGTGSIVFGNLSGGVSGTGTLTIGDGTNRTVLQFPTFSGGSSVGSLVINANSTLDLTNNHIYVNYAPGSDPIATIRSYLTSGYNSGSWNGPGIDSSFAAMTHGEYGLGYADSADAGNPAGLDTNQIEIAYTLYGDANLDYDVDGIDYGILAANYDKGVTGWDQGDFNYDNVVNGIDFGLLEANFGDGASGYAIKSPSNPNWAPLFAFAEANGLMADVPEPATLGTIAMVGLAVLQRRRRRAGE